MHCLLARVRPPPLPSPLLSGPCAHPSIDRAPSTRPSSLHPLSPHCSPCTDRVSPNPEPISPNRRLRNSPFEEHCLFRCLPPPHIPPRLEEHSGPSDEVETKVFVGAFRRSTGTADGVNESVGEVLEMGSSRRSHSVFGTHSDDVSGNDVGEKLDRDGKEG